MKIQQVQVALEEAEEAADEQRVKELRRRLNRLKSGNPMGELFERIGPLLTDEQRKRLEKIRPRRDHRPPPIIRGSTDPVARIRRLRSRLELTPDQQQLFDRLLSDLTERLKGPEQLTDQKLRIVEAVQEAVEAGDEQRITELREQLAALRRAARQEVIDQFYSQLMPILTDEQRQIVERARRGHARSRTIDARRLLALARRLDLRPEQRRELREIERRMRQALRQAGRDRAARQQVAEAVEKDIRAMLDEPQTARFDELLARYRSDRRSSGVTVRGRAAGRRRAAPGATPQSRPAESGQSEETP